LHTSNTCSVYVSTSLLQDIGPYLSSLTYTHTHTHTHTITKWDHYISNAGSLEPAITTADALYWVLYKVIL